jgi:hypothetical protein
MMLLFITEFSRLKKLKTTGEYQLYPSYTQVCFENNEISLIIEDIF